MNEIKTYKLWITEKYSVEEEFTGTEQELEEFLDSYEVNTSSANYDFNVDVLSEKEV